MKKYFQFIFLCLLGLTFQSCDDEENEGVEEPIYTIARLSYSFSDDFLSLYNVQLTTTDFNGVTDTMEITQSGEQKYEIKTDAKKDSAMAELSITFKGVYPEVDSLTNIELDYYVIPFTGKTKDGQSYSKVNSSTLFNEKIEYKGVSLLEDSTKLEKFYERLITLSSNQRIIFSFSETESPNYTIENF